MNGLAVSLLLSLVVPLVLVLALGPPSCGPRTAGLPWGASDSSPGVVYRADSPEYGMNVFIWDSAEVARRDLGGQRAFTFRRVEDLRGIMERNGDGSKQIWITEFGWTSDTMHPEYSWFRVSEEQKAANILAAFRWATAHWAPWIGVMALWNLPDPTWSYDREEYWWSIANNDGTPRSAYVALKAARQDGSLPQRVDAGRSEGSPR